ncbi:MAG: SCO family protein [Crocinitomicaceae bacterium]|nr:SCO family protein [Crocinitomicaceae bacterium]
MRYLVFFVVIAMILFSCEENERLPFLGHADIDYSTNDTVYPKIPEFEYLNQDSILIKSGDMKGKIWIADFFFTTCPTICPVMTTQMKRLNGMTEDLSEHIQFMSFSIAPKHDQPSQLMRYIDHHGIKANNWHFFTGDESATHLLGVESFLVHAAADEEAPGGYAHSGAFTLVDKEGYVRGVYMGTETEEVNRLEKDLRILLKDEYGIE